MNVNLSGKSVMRTVACAVVALGGVALMTACGAQGDDEAQASSAPQQASSATMEPSVAADDSIGPDEAVDEALSDDTSGIAIYADAYAAVVEPTLTWQVEGQVLEFTFPTGAVDDKAEYHCLIAVNSISNDNPEFDLKMTYPDGSVLCSEMDL